MKNNKQIICAIIASVIVTAIVAVFFASYYIGWYIAENHTSAADTSVSPTQSPVVEINQRFDSSALNVWGCGDPDESIRMVGATYSGIADDGSTIVQDDFGNTWIVVGSVNEYDFLLLWISDNGTNDTADDLVIKTWKEVH